MALADAVTVEGDGTADEPEDEADEKGDQAPTLTLADVHEVAQRTGRPVLTAAILARELDTTQAAASDALDALERAGDVERLDVSGDPVVWYPATLEDLTVEERVVVFPTAREIIVDRPEQYTRARLTQFAHLAETTGDGAYRYEIRPEDVWRAPYDDLESLIETVRGVCGGAVPDLEEYVESQWDRARQFVLETHPDGYTVLEGRSPEVMGNVARQHLDETQLRAAISETESWVAEGAETAIKRILYEAGYPVRDERDLERGEALDVEVTIPLRDYQRDWVERFTDRGAGVLVGPPGSGKTVAAMAIAAAVGGETLILVPGRELADQWERALLEDTTLSTEQVGQYHGGEKAIRPVTIATYQIAGMDRHRALFDDREWGLVIFDEVHHVPSEVYRRSTHLQSRHRLGLTATPVREDDRETDIYALVGPPIGTDWEALFEAGFVAEPELEIRYVPWRDDAEEGAYAAADGRERHRIAATNPAKLREVRYLLASHPNAAALVFVDYLEQGRQLAEALEAPFLSGETPHGRREELLREFRAGELSTLIVSRVGDEGLDLPMADLAIVASGLGGSRRQGTQRAGRTMRPAGGAMVYVLATRGTVEEDFARRQLRHLGRKGVRVSEETVSR